MLSVVVGSCSGLVCALFIFHSLGSLWPNDMGRSLGPVFNELARLTNINRSK